MLDRSVSLSRERVVREHGVIVVVDGVVLVYLGDPMALKTWQICPASEVVLEGNSGSPNKISAMTARDVRISGRGASQPSSSKTYHSQPTTCQPGAHTTGCEIPTITTGCRPITCVVYWVAPKSSSGARYMRVHT